MERTAAVDKPRKPRIPDVLWAPAAAGSLMLLIGAIAVAARQPWLFPSLGPTAFLQAEYPNHKTARVYHIVAGHLLGLGAGFLALALVGAANSAPAIAGAPVNKARVLAAAIAVALTMFFELLVRASHPPAVATTLLITLGALAANLHDAIAVVTGVILVAALGEVIRRVRLRGAPPPEPERAEPAA